MSDITVYITSDLTSSERKVSPQWQIDYFKQKLELITGISPEFQTLHYYAISNSNDYKVLISPSLKSDGYVSDWNLTPFSRIHVIDENPDSELRQLANNDIQEYKMTDEEYAKRSDTVLQWKTQNKLGRFHPEYQKEKTEKLRMEEEAAANIHVDDRCRIISIAGERRGVVKFVGKIKQLDDGEGIWVGIEFDEPVGKNDGLIGNVQIFTCKANHGSFVKPQKVEVGDFPEESLFSDEDEL